MASGFWGQQPISAREIGGAGPVPIGGKTFHNVAAGAETFEIVKSESAEYVVLRCEAGTHRVGAGKLDARSFDDGDVSVLDDEITITDHGYETGDGPLFLSPGTVALQGGPDLTFADADPDTITRSAGSWIADGFVAGMVITVSGSASNDGTFTIDSLTATVLTLDAGDTLVAEGPSGGITVTGQGVLPDGLSEDTEYWVHVVDDDTIRLCASPGAANRIKQTGPSSSTESDAIAVDITDAVGGGTHSIGGFQGSGNPVGFTPADLPAADEPDGGGSTPLLTNEFILFTGRAITVRATAASDVLTWWEV